MEKRGVLSLSSKQGLGCLEAKIPLFVGYF